MRRKAVFERQTRKKTQNSKYHYRETCPKGMSYFFKKEREEIKCITITAGIEH